MLGFMSETPSSSEPATGPVATAKETAAAPPPTYAEPRRHSRLTAVTAWVGIVAGVVFIVAVIFFSGFVLGAHSGGGHRGGHHRDGEVAIFHKGAAADVPDGPARRVRASRPRFPASVWPRWPELSGAPGASAAAAERSEHHCTATVVIDRPRRPGPSQTGASCRLRPGWHDHAHEHRSRFHL